jgi:cytochrome c biogenesis protein CcmG/thiol:disulfide interchange protein DsbE
VGTEVTVERGGEQVGEAHPIPARGRPRIIRWVVVVTSAAFLVPLLFVLGSRLGKDPRFVRSPLLGKPAPALDLPRIDTTGRISSGDLAGRVYVVNFWASWCVPCIEETPALESFYRRWGPRGVELVGILYNDTVDAARQFREQYGGSWPLVDDPGGRAGVDHGVFGVPETFVVDERGVVMAKLIGAVGPTTLDEVLTSLEAGGGPVTSSNDRYQRR